MYSVACTKYLSGSSLKQIQEIANSQDGAPNYHPDYLFVLHPKRERGPIQTSERQIPGKGYPQDDSELEKHHSQPFHSFTQ